MKVETVNLPKLKKNKKNYTAYKDVRANKLHANCKTKRTKSSKLEEWVWWQARSNTKALAGSSLGKCGMMGGTSGKNKAAKPVVTTYMILIVPQILERCAKRLRKRNKFDEYQNEEKTRNDIRRRDDHYNGGKAAEGTIMGKDQNTKPGGTTAKNAITDRTMK